MDNVIVSPGGEKERGCETVGSLIPGMNGHNEEDLNEAANVGELTREEGVIIEEVDRILGKEKNTHRKKRRRKKPWGPKKRGIKGMKTLDDPDLPEEVVEPPVTSPAELMVKLTKKDINLKYKLEMSGNNVNYLDLKIEVCEGKINLDIYRKPTHDWDLPNWKSRTPLAFRKAAVFPLLIRVYQLIRDIDRRTNEIRTIFKHSVNKGYPIRGLKRWACEAELISRRNKEDAQVKKIFRNVVTSSLDRDVKKVLGPAGVQMVSRKSSTLFNVIRSDIDRRSIMDTPGVYIHGSSTQGI